MWYTTVAFFVGYMIYNVKTADSEDILLKDTNQFYINLIVKT